VCYMLCICFSCCSALDGMYKLEDCCFFLRFLEISRNRLAALKARQAAHAPKPIFWVFCYAPPGGYALPARRHPFALPVFLDRKLSLSYL